VDLVQQHQLLDSKEVLDLDRLHHPLSVAVSAFGNKETMDIVVNASL
jgi:hypothetical protein